MDIKELRAKAGMTQQQFAVALGLTIRTISAWETGDAKPSPLAAEKLIAFERKYARAA